LPPALLLAILISTPALAQIDSDPLNDSLVSADVLSLAAGDAISNLAVFTGDGGDIDFFKVSLASADVLLGFTAPMDSLPVDMEFPDTLASVMFAGVPLTFSDDDFSETSLWSEEIIFGRGSMFRVRASEAGTYNVAITGYPDYEFDGNASGDPHDEVGPYALTVARVNPANLGGNFNDTDATNHTTSGADPISIASPGAAVSVLDLLPSDVDYYQLTLAEGDLLSVMTAPLADSGSFDVPDTLLGLYDANGALIVENDDAGDFGYNDLEPDLGSDSPADVIFGSAIHALIPAAGTYYLRVEESPDANGIQVGRYAMLVGVQPTGLTPPTPGDFNEDGALDAADYVVWRKLVGDPYDETDYDLWVQNFGALGAGTGGASIGNVPEPTPAVLLMIACVAMLFLNRLRLDTPFVCRFDACAV
jgi:hypothetical protein